MYINGGVVLIKPSKVRNWQRDEMRLCSFFFWELKYRYANEKTLFQYFTYTLRLLLPLAATTEEDQVFHLFSSFFCEI